MSLGVLKPTLVELAASEVRVPAVPIATALQEAHDLMRFTAEPAVHRALLAVGLPADFSTQLEQRINAAREAQSIWVSERDQNKSRELVEAEAQAVEMRSALIAAGRYNLAGNAEAQAVLSSIAGGEGVADLVQDLHDLAELVDRHADTFDVDRSFDAAQQVKNARELSKLLSAHVSAERVTPPNTARDLRDRAFSFLYELVSRVRSAGRYVFRTDADTRKRFGSRYRRRVRRRRASDINTASGDAVTDVGTSIEEIVEEELAQE